jgi:Ca2+-binding EF-hand superfamily protein
MGQVHGKSSLSPAEFDALMRDTKFTSAEINDWYQKFRKDFPRGNIRPYEFKVVYRSMFPEGNADEFCEHIFRCYDIDGNGTISFREFITTLHVASRGTPEEKLRSTYRMYDIDRNGHVSLEEIRHILTVSDHDKRIIWSV